MAPIPTGAENAEGAAQQGAQGTGPAPAAGAIGGGRNFAGSQRRIISELERINALNLEPSLPKVDDGNRSVSRHTQDRDRVKNEFQQFLTVMKKNDEQKAGNQQPTAGASSSQSKAGPPDMARSSSQPAKFQPMFTVEYPGPENKSMSEVLDEMLTQANTSVKTQTEPAWPEANGPSYHEVLGRPTGKPSEAGMNGAPDASSGFRPPPNQGQGQGQQGQHNNQQRPPMHDQAQQMRPMGPPGNVPQQNAQQPPQGYMMAPQGQQGGQPQMMFMPGMQGGPQGMQGMQGMPMQQMQFGQQQGGQMMMMGPGGQMMMPMQMPGGQQPGPGGQNPQGMGMQGGQMMVGPDGQQQQMMFMPMMMGQDGQGGQGGMMMMPQGMQGYGQGGQGGQQQGGFMMQQPMFQQQGGGSG